jgi:hypothetical protein
MVVLMLVEMIIYKPIKPKIIGYVLAALLRRLKEIEQNRNFEWRIEINREEYIT